MHGALDSCQEGTGEEMVRQPAPYYMAAHIIWPAHIIWQLQSSTTGLPGVGAALEPCSAMCKRCSLSLNF